MHSEKHAVFRDHVIQPVGGKKLAPPLEQYLTAAATEQVVYAFVTSRLDIDNALIYRLLLKQMQQLHKIHNWAARLIDGAMRYSYATPLLKK